MNIFDKKIEKAKSICIVGHANPDGDCIGSVLSIYRYIKNKYGDAKKVKPYLDTFSDRFNILPDIKYASYDTNDAEIYDLSISVDVPSFERMKEFARYFKEAKDKLVFDHHEKNNIEADDKIVKEEAIATCEIVYDYLDKKFIDKDLAMYLYMGLATDSGVFRYKQTSRKTFTIAGELIEYGFEFTKLLDTIIFDNTVNQRKAQALVFNRLRLLCKGQVSYSYILDEEMEELHISKADIDNIIVYLREITGIKVAAFAYSTGHDIYKLSLRSKIDSINVAEFARLHDGGGHALASGCLYYGDIDTVSEHFEKDIDEFIKEK